MSAVVIPVAAFAGATRPTPTVRVVPPPAPTGPVEPDDLPGPPLDVMKNVAKVDLPAIPSFEMPLVEPGFHGPRELRIYGKRTLDTRIRVKGYVTWVYNCVDAMETLRIGAGRASIHEAIESDPSLCERTKFYLGDSRTTPREASIWVVDVPRPPNKLERQRMDTDQLKLVRSPMNDVPIVEVGDYVVVTGTWALQSPHAEHNTDGLLVYESLEHAPAPASTLAQPPRSTEPELEIVTAAPMRKVVSPRVWNSSAAHLNACNSAMAAAAYDAAIVHCGNATSLWDGNHLGWYVLASAHMAKGAWAQGRDAAGKAVALRPDLGMYQMAYGIARYEAERQRVRDDLASREHKKPEEVDVDTSVLKLDEARDALRRAIKLAPDLWRAHFYLGRVYRDLDDPLRAAEQHTLAIRLHPGHRWSYVALSELYRRWDYFDRALSVALAGTGNVAPGEVIDLWLEVGMAYEAKRADDQAIAAFEQVLARKPHDAISKLQRGQIYFRKGDFEHAKRDLEDVVSSSDPRVTARQPIAKQILVEITRRQR